MDFAFDNVTSIRGFTSMLKLVCEKTRMLWVLQNASKIACPYHPIHPDNTDG